MTLEELELLVKVVDQAKGADRTIALRTLKTALEEEDVVPDDLKAFGAKYPGLLKEVQEANFEQEDEPEQAK